MRQKESGCTRKLCLMCLRPWLTILAQATCHLPPRRRIRCLAHSLSLVASDMLRKLPSLRWPIGCFRHRPPAVPRFRVAIPGCLPHTRGAPAYYLHDIATPGATTAPTGRMISRAKISPQGHRGVIEAAFLEIHTDRHPQHDGRELFEKHAGCGGGLWATTTRARRG